MKSFALMLSLRICLRSSSEKTKKEGEIEQDAQNSLRKWGAGAWPLLPAKKHKLNSCIHCHLGPLWMPCSRMKKLMESRLPSRSNSILARINRFHLLTASPASNFPALENRFWVLYCPSTGRVCGQCQLKPHAHGRGSSRALRPLRAVPIELPGCLCHKFNAFATLVWSLYCIYH